MVELEILRMETYDGIVFDQIALVSNFEFWIDAYIGMQEQVDMLIVSNPIGLEEWDEEAALEIIQQETRIPTGCNANTYIQYAMMGQMKVTEEQGWWAGQQAVKILQGVEVSQIPLSTNQNSYIMLNMPLINHLGIKIPGEIMDGLHRFSNYQYR